MAKSSRKQELCERHLHYGPGATQLNKPSKFPSNFIRTSKYNIITFLPKSLLLQFMKYANWYFLASAILQCIPQISTQTPISSIAPLAFVIFLSILREGLEDIKRHKSDSQMNASECILWRNGEWKRMKWANVIIGDIMLAREEEIIAADAVILCSSLKTGQSFIETSSLDGEKNLKPRAALTETQALLFPYMQRSSAVLDSKLPELKGNLTCSLPNPHLHFFEGCLNHAEGSDSKTMKLAMNIKNLLLRGSRIKNVDWAISLVVSTGQDTKIMKNANQGKNKLSSIDKKCNTYIIYVMILQSIICTFVSIMSVISCEKTFNLTIYLKEEIDCRSQVFLTFASYVLLLNTMIPISLIVSLEFIKVGQAYYMERDPELYSKFNEQPAKVFACTMNEELGQIEHVFTDKTGTLTCNKMEFKMLICGKETYGDYNLTEPTAHKEFERNQDVAVVAGRARMPSFIDKRAGVEFCFDDQRLKRLLQSDDSTRQHALAQPIEFLSEEGKLLYKISTQRQLAFELLMLLSTCHECVLQLNKTTNAKQYQGPSPDEIALVDAASRMGFSFQGVDGKNLVLEVLKQQANVEVLQLVEFDSDRKRMSVIIRDSSGLIKMYVKGADSIIKSRLNKAIPQPFLSNIDESLEQFSVKGLRTLCLAVKVLSESEYAKISAAVQDSVGKPGQEKVLKNLAEEFEKNLTLLGATAVEDRLQDNVPAVLRDFLKANINVWMLTGDKLETAENIARSCNLISSEMGVMYLRGSTNQIGSSHIDSQLNELKRAIPDLLLKHPTGLAIVVEGESLTWILGEDTRKNHFLSVVQDTKSVVCCRVTPKQKAEVVRLVKEKLKKITLAIGDGANDVNMIQEAHIGVGIYGNEGMRAVQASDYAIGQFQFLWKLVLYHGRLNYIRVSECILYFFYKNFVITFPQFFFAFSSKFSGQSIFDDWYITFYNCIFTFWPVVIKSVYEEDIYYRKQRLDDKHIHEKFLKSKVGNEDGDVIQEFYPKLYYIGQSNRIFQFTRFLKWVLLGIIQGALCFYLNAISFNQGFFDERGYTTDIWSTSISIYTSIIILVNMKLALNTQMWTIWNWLGFIITSFVFYFAYIWVADVMPSSSVQYTAVILFTSSKFYLSVSITILTCFSFDFLLLSLKNSKESLLNYFKKVTRESSSHSIELDRIQQLEDKLKRELIEKRGKQITIQGDSPSKHQYKSGAHNSSNRGSSRADSDARNKKKSSSPEQLAASSTSTTSTSSNEYDHSTGNATVIQFQMNSLPYQQNFDTDLEISSESTNQKHQKHKDIFLKNQHL